MIAKKWGHAPTLPPPHHPESTSSWVLYLIDKKGKTIIEVFQKTLDESGPNPNQIWVDNNKFYNRSMKPSMQDYNIEISFTYNEETPVVPERFVKTFKNNNNKHLTGVLKNMYFNKFSGIVDAYNNTIHSSIKIKPVNVIPDTCINFDNHNNIRKPIFEAGDHVRISKHKNIFARVIYQIEQKKCL